jgi:NAD(P)-dependent dehydrogenase (short-subunit alcohol dehydrogenase family)
MDKVMVVTGGGRGIGAACARLGAAQGYRVCVNYARNRAAAAALVTQISAAGGRALAVQADVADPAQVRRMFETDDSALGTVTALVNNAGITGALKPVEDIDRAGLDAVFGVNVYSLFWYCAQAVRRKSPPLGRLGESEEIAEGILWLLSDKASYVHGAIHDVSGGR